MIKKFNLKIWLWLLVGTGTIEGQDLLNLKEAIRLALKNNYNIALALNDSIINKTNNTFGNAGFLPELSLNMGQNFNLNNTKQEFFSGDVRQGSSVNSNTRNANLLLAWTAFDGMKMFVNKDRLREIEEIGKLNIKIQIENTISQIMMAYFDIEQQQRKLETIRKSVEISKERLAIAQVKKDIGSGSGIEILQAEVDINTDSVAIIRQKLAILSGKIQLNEIIGRDPNIEFNTITEDDPYEYPDYEEAIKKAEERNNMLQLAEKNISIAVLNTKQMESNKYPTVDLNLGYNFTRFQTEIGVLKFNQNTGLSFGIAGRWNLFNGWNNKREIQITKLNTESTKIVKEQTALQVKSAILTAHNQLTTFTELQKVEDNNILIAQKSLFITIEKMRLGTIDALELRQAQLNFIEANFRKISAIFEAKLAGVDILKLSGELIN